MDPRKITWCCGCYLEYTVGIYGDAIEVVPAPTEWSPRAVELYIAGAPPVEGQPSPDLGRLLGVLKDPEHCDDGDCLIWLARNGAGGLAFHQATELGIMDEVLRASAEYVPAESVENVRTEPTGNEFHDS